jgi:tRNA A-37 threonylcarbamoyl transferase component Bud32
MIINDSRSAENSGKQRKTDQQHEINQQSSSMYAKEYTGQVVAFPVEKEQKPAADTEICEVLEKSKADHVGTGQCKLSNVSKGQLKVTDVSRGKRMLELTRQKKTESCAKNVNLSKLSIHTKSELVLKKKTSRVPKPEVTGNVTRSGSCNVREIDRSLISKLSDVPVGCGTFGNCFLASYRGIKVVVKEMKGNNSSEIDKQRCRREALHEASVLNSPGDHPGLPLLFGVCSDASPYSIVLHFHGRESESLTLLKAANKKMFDKIQKISAFRDICNVLDYIHSNGYLHNDLKANNVLLQQDNEKAFSPKIIDFGKSRLINKPRH